MRRSIDFDLGLDTTRIKDVRDALRQTATVDAILGRLFNPNAGSCWEIQVLADEVGMGKTFVALGAAYSILQGLRKGERPDDLRGCYRKILIVTPSNSALFAKWNREVGEFVKRCVRPECRADANQWFRPVAIERIDDLVAELRRRSKGPQIIVASTNIFTGGRLKYYDIKRRHLLKVLFRHWGNRFTYPQRSRLLLAAPEEWARDPRTLREFDETDAGRLCFTSDEIADAINQLEKKNNSLDKLLELCRELAEPYARNRTERFTEVESSLVKIYRELLPHLVRKAVPLVIVDEAHNWKNGPTGGSNGYGGFQVVLGKKIRRILLLTATPFQLRPAEMLEILKVSDLLSPCRSRVDSEARCTRLKDHRTLTIASILESAARHGRAFAKAWSRVPPSIDSKVLSDVWNSSSIQAARTELIELAKMEGVVPLAELERLISEAVRRLEPEVRQLFREGLRLLVYNSDLSCELGAIVIRHRRYSAHRNFRVGIEYQDKSRSKRSDRHVLHASPGVDVKGNGELPHYLLMRCVSEMKGGRGRSSLGSALTGCYSTLIGSAEGRAVKANLGASETGKVYLDLLMNMVGEHKDPNHPKLREVVDSVIENWKQGEKTLIFCFRTNTAKRLHEIIDERIRVELDQRRDRCMGGAGAMRSLRSRLTGKDRDLVGLGMDRVLWSLLWNEQLQAMAQRPISPSDLVLSNDELVRAAEISSEFGIDLLSERIDRVFLHRLTENIIARRLLDDISPHGQLKQILEILSDTAWIAGPYGFELGTAEEEAGADSPHFDERGIHTIYAKKSYDGSDAVAVGLELRDRRNRAGVGAIVDAYSNAPNLWLGVEPRGVWEANRAGAIAGETLTVGEIQAHIWAMTIIDGHIDWESRRTVFQAIRRAVLRESVLLRILPSVEERDNSKWGNLLVDKFYSPLPGQSESTADKIAVFLEDLMAASGDINTPGSARFSLFDATKLRDQQFVALVSGTHGSRDRVTRERVFSGFNSPLLPEVLVCTSVGQEGIDLHRHCRHVVHFDLPWNPAVMEQRTGRTDRIGSKTFRERARSESVENSFLDIGVPYLAGTYDERIYEELRLRAQTFEVLTGGDLTADEADGRDDGDQPEGSESGIHFVALPDSMVDALRVSLHVWEDPTTLPTDNCDEAFQTAATPPAP